jgi:penicillin-binding protein 1A
LIGSWQRRSPRARIAIAGSVAAIVLLAAVWSRCGLIGCPDVRRLTSYQPGGAPVLLDRNGRPFADLAPVEGEIVPLRSLPRHVPQAFLAAEDRRFYEHGAVDLRRVVGALFANLKAGGFEEGSSTLTMQLARNAFPDRIPGRKRTLGRKLLEVRVAQEIEDQFSKDEILELYLNHIYFGNGARGIEAAARHYFGIPARRLSLPQAALLAGLPKGPSLYDPRRNPKPSRARRDLILGLMEEQKRISPEQAAAARQAPLGVVRKARTVRGDDGFAPYFVEEVRRELEDELGDSVYDETLRIRTTLDATLQAAAEQELERQLKAVESGALGRFTHPRYPSAAEGGEEGTPYLQGVVVALAADSGDVLAWVGGRDFLQSRFDRVRSSRRQVGSAFKPFVYATALAAGHSLSELVSDEPLRVSLGGRQSWAPQNFDGRFEGQVTLRDALVRSRNVPTVRLAQTVGVSEIVGTAERAGIEPPIPDQPSMALGTVSVSPLELTAAYTPFAASGQGVKPRLVLRVERPDGKVLWAPEPERRHVLEADVAYLITDVLREAITRGTGTAVRQAGFQGPVAGKTGTTNEGTDAWFVGYTPEVVASVWMGFDQPRPIVPQATGGRLAAPVWARMMLRFYRGRPMPKPWSLPSGVIEASVDPATGLALAPGCQPQDGAARREVFLAGNAPREVCPWRGEPVFYVPGSEPVDEELMADLPPEEPVIPPTAPPATEPAAPPQTAAPSPPPSPEATPTPAAPPEASPSPDSTPSRTPTPPPH